VLCRCSVQHSFSTSAVNLSGHNKWSKIKQKKGVMDAQRSMIYGRAARDIVVAARTGGSADPERNAALAAVLKAAKAQGVPKANVENALKKASGGKDKGNQLATFEAVAHGTVGVMIECLTDNSNRTIHKLRQVLNTHNARFAPVGFLFVRKGLVRIALDKEPVDDLNRRIEQTFDAALTTPAEDFRVSSDSDDPVEIDITCAPHDLAKVTAAVTTDCLYRELLTSELVYVPREKAEEPDEELEAKVASMVESLEENEDTLRVYTTLD